MTAALRSRGTARVFLSYSSKNDAHRLRFLSAIKPLERKQLLEVWVDRKILPGDRWDARIAEELASADLIVPLVSIDFLASEYCHHEITTALERERRGEALLVPILVEPCDLADSPLAEIQMLPGGMRPVSRWESPDEAWTEVVAGLRRVIAQWREGAVPKAGVGVAVQEAPDPTRYLQYLRTHHGYVELRGMGAQSAERLPLDEVYIRLRAAGSDGRRSARGGKHHGPEDPAMERQSTRELAEVLAEHRHVALVGDPGSGKTTFVRYLAQQLARAGLGEKGALARVGMQAGGQEPPLPVFVRIERMARFLVENPLTTCSAEAPEHFLRYLNHTQEGHDHDLPPGYLRQRVADGGCCVLLDGLDEVAGEALRQRMSALIENVVLEFPANRYVVTCRTRAWEGRTAIATGVAPFRLGALEPAQVERFCETWSRALFRVPPGVTNGQQYRDAMEYRDTLLRAIDENPGGETFTENPLLLTVLAVVHWTGRKLPDQRAELYDRAVEYLLDSRRELAGRETVLRKECLRTIAAAMMEHADGVQRSLGFDEAAKAVADVLDCDEAEALAFVEHETLLSGLLVSRSEGEVEFWHLVFQEFLAAVELEQADDRWPRIAPHLFSDRWSEVLLLLGGCLAKHRGRRGPRDYLRWLLSQGTGTADAARAVALASRIRRDVLAYGHDAASGTDFEAMLDRTLALFRPGAEDVEESVRVEVGEALGEVGDPRLDGEDENRVRIAGGTFLMGAQRDDRHASGYDPNADEHESPPHRVTVSPFLAARYPVTVAAYGAFMAAGAYDRVELWSSDGWAWRTREAVDMPAGWPAQRRHGNRPVTGVCWYEAMAFACWRGARLPTEAQWEWMARGAAGRRYPWGDEEPTPAHASYAFRIEHPTPVGIYPHGLTPEGVVDLAGNVWEWCADWYGSYPVQEQTDPAGPRKGNRRVLRGGAFLDRPDHLRAADRFNGGPGGRGGFVGFRLVWLSPEDN